MHVVVAMHQCIVYDTASYTALVLLITHLVGSAALPATSTVLKATRSAAPALGVAV